MSTKDPDLACQQVVERVTDYLEGALSAEDSAQLEQHLVLCAACATYFEQHRGVVAALHRVQTSEPAVPTANPDARAAALAAFRKLRGAEKP
jgi:predicted anti-sigma-YlaC factor YlaD